MYFHGNFQGNNSKTKYGERSGDSRIYAFRDALLGVFIKETFEARFESVFSTTSNMKVSPTEL